MQVLSAAQIRDWDAYTIRQEPVSSIDLMERAAGKAFGWLQQQYPASMPACVFCGRGNNGGDGLAIARMLLGHGYSVVALVLPGDGGSPDFRVNLQRLKNAGGQITILQSADDLPVPPPNAFMVDALFGTGLSRPLQGFAAEVVRFLNSCQNDVVSIDMPSGLPADEVPSSDCIVMAAVTLSFQCPKLSFFMPEAEAYTGQWIVLDIGLHPSFLEGAGFKGEYVLPTRDWMLPERLSVFAHKGQRGHLLLGAGSAEMMGAAVMAVYAALRSGVGLVTCASPDSGWPLLQAQAPEAICGTEALLTDADFAARRKISSLAVGPGWPADRQHAQYLEALITGFTQPLLLDATALQLLSEQPGLLAERPSGAITILTPHVGEFDRLFGPSANHFDRLQKAKDKAAAHHVIIVLKGAYTRTITPGGLVYFNSTGNAGMAKGGSGDVLTGLIGGLLAQHYPPVLAALLGVYLHGLAGDIAAEKYSQQGMTAMDTARSIPEAWVRLGKKI